MKTIYTEIEIDASAETVWNILADFGAYAQWNPFITNGEGHAAVGEQLAMQFENNGRTFKFKPIVKVVEQGRELVWHGRLLFPGLYDGKHSFVIKPLSDERILLEHSEQFTGILVPLINRGSFAENTQGGFQAMNEALKQLAEKKGVVRP